MLTNTYLQFFMGKEIYKSPVMPFLTCIMGA